MSFLPLILILVALAAIVAALAVYRRTLLAQDAEVLHVLDSDAAVIPRQAIVAKKLEVVDRWGKILTAVLVVYGLALAALYLYKVWQDTSGMRIS